MKQVKILMLALVVLMGVGFTSCMNGENDTTVREDAFVKVVSYMGSTWFEDANGFRYYPTDASLAAMKTQMGFEPVNGGMAYVIYQYDSATQTKTATSTSLKDLQLLYATKLDATVESVQHKPEEGEEPLSNDSIAKAPIRGLEGTISTSYGNITYKPIMFDESTLLLQIDYFMGPEGLLSHYFTLVHYRDESVDENTIKLYLRHNNGKDTSTSYTSVNYLNQYPFVFYKAFNLGKLDGSINENTKIIIEVQENNTNIDLESEQTKTKTCTVQIKAKE